MFDIYLCIIHTSVKSTYNVGVCHLCCKILEVSFFPFFVTYVCQYRKVYPFNGGSPLVQSSAYDFHFIWNQVPYAVGKNIPLLPFFHYYLGLHLAVGGIAACVLGIYKNKYKIKNNLTYIHLFLI